jgi:hypothetical protein
MEIDTNHMAIHTIHVSKLLNVAQLVSYDKVHNDVVEYIKTEPANQWGAAYVLVYYIINKIHEC